MYGLLVNEYILYKVYYFLDKVLNGVGDVGKVCLDEFRKIFFGLVQGIF